MIKNKKAERDSLIKQKNILKRNHVNQKKARERKKEAAALNQTLPAAQDESECVTPRSAGRPTIIDDDILIKTITDMALIGSSVYSRRRTEVINCCKSLDDLTDKLKGLGYNLSRSSVYLRLLPRRKDSFEGKRDKKVVNVKLCIAMPMQRAKNPDRWFASATMHHVEDFAVLMGRGNVAILGKDD